MSKYTVDDILTKVQKNIQGNNVNFQTWEDYFQYYNQARNMMALDLQSLVKLNRILTNATVYVKSTEDKNRFKLEMEFLKKDLSKLYSMIKYFENAFDDNGFLKPEWVITGEQKNKMLYGNDIEIVEKSSPKR